jgi:hypothetical protein
MKHSLTALGIAAGLSFALYVGSYLVVVIPSDMKYSTGNGPWRPMARCRFGRGWAPSIYLPLMILDERLAPKRWDPPERVL